MLSILIVEDDKYQRQALIKIIQETNTMYNILEASNISEARETIKSNDIDLFYIDIGLGMKSGLDLAFEIRKVPRYRLTWIIFITTHVKYMIEAFKEVHCYDYILKPYDKELVKKEMLILTENLVSQSSTTVNEKSIVFSIKNGISIKLFLKDILFIEVFIRTCYVHTKHGKYTIKNLSLRKVMQMIDDKNFMQCHRAYLVNIKNIKEIRKDTNSWKICFDRYEDTALLGDSFRKSIMSIFKYNNIQLYT